MITLKLVLLLLAFLLFVLAALGVPSTRVNLLAAGLAVWVLAAVVT